MHPLYTQMNKISIVKYCNLAGNLTHTRGCHPLNSLEVSINIADISFFSDLFQSPQKSLSLRTFFVKQSDLSQSSQSTQSFFDSLSHGSICMNHEVR